MKIKVADFGEFDMPENFTFREMNFIKKMTGLRAGELYPALNAGDSDVYVAFALTAMRRVHADVVEEEILDLQIDEITLVVEESDREAEKADPPVGGDPASVSDVTPPDSIPSTTGIHAVTG